MNAEAAELIFKLGLSPLPDEGGFFAATWTSACVGPDGRASGSAILFLITAQDFSALHRLRTDEIWHFYAGDPAKLALLDPASGKGRTVFLGPDVIGAHVPQAVAPAGVWQGATLSPPPGSAGRGWALFGCTLSPAWDGREFELGRRDELLRAFPGNADLIRGLTR